MTPPAIKKLSSLVSVGFTALPHMHGDEIGTDVRRTAVDRNIVTGHKVLRTFKTGEAFLMAGTDFFGPDRRRAVGARDFCLRREDGGEMLGVKILLIKCAKVAVHDARDVRFVE